MEIKLTIVKLQEKLYVPLDDVIKLSAEFETKIKQLNIELAACGAANLPKD